MDSLSYAVMHRAGIRSPEGDGRREQVSIDFLVNGASLLNELVRRSGGHSDLMGCIAKGFVEGQQEAISKLKAQAPPDTQTGRVVLYGCPECGDIGCGAYSVFIESTADGYVWQAFAYENGYEPAMPLEALGPFRFAHEHYDETLFRAVNAL